MWKHIRNLSILVIILALIFGWWLTRPDVAQYSTADLSGERPIIGEAREQTFPTINVANVDRWKKDESPIVAKGLTVTRFADDLDHPRNIIVLPNGDILVAETNKPPADGGGLTGMMARYLMGKAGAGVPSANRITLLRDANGDGVPEVRSKFVDGLNSPFGMAVVGDNFYVANTDAILRFDYKEGDTALSGKGEEIYKLNATAPNMHWTRNLIASPDGKKLYIAVGSNSNIGENGMDSEKGRAMIIEYDLEKKKAGTYSSGLRNPVGMDWDAEGQLWTVVNERDMLGSDLVPDYLAAVEFAADYGWPHHYWGGYTDYRVQPEMPEKRQYERRPDYALGAHTAPLGIAFEKYGLLGANYAGGAFIARHGSWNREPAAGYDVVFVPFKAGKPVGKPIDILTGFLDENGKAKGRPTIVAMAKDGSLLVSDDVGNIIWRVSKSK
ncbi:sorbosone dehydrogenase [Sphingorhabdus lutea]|uniref:Sorbosone dehydrogenase n=1 Tax=Sphingorhabdus lutea TaxID=1913578 RepID=A0A1L3JB20_9SPHN|nr:sorbosone dehydrogenase family protein [Sphingorhabdus lutea]APG62309.1 sorbosone dehydrogenase [Sphingorhabdus lutea]